MPSQTNSPNKSRVTLAFSPKGSTNLVQNSPRTIRKNYSPIQEAVNLDFSYGKQGPMHNWINTMSYLIKSGSLVDSMYLSNNDLDQIPDEVYQLPIKFLDLSYNQIKALEATIKQMKIVRELNCAVNQISSVPTAIGDCSQLRILSFYKNNITTFPDVFAKLPNLTRLDLSANRLFDIPKSLFISCNQLQILDLSFNQLSSISADIGNLKNLENLSLAGNMIKTIPSQLFKMSHLKELNISRNQISFFNFPEIKDLVQLKELYINHNYIADLPMEIEANTKLEVLDVRKNPLKYLPSGLSKLKFLDSLIIEESHPTLSMPDSTIIAKGTKAILNFLEDLTNEDVDYKKCTISGPGVETVNTVKEHLSFTVKAVDKFGRQKIRDGDEFFAEIKNLATTSATQLSAKYISDGSYEFVYDARKAGQYQITVWYEKKECNIGKPMVINLQPDILSPSRCMVGGDGSKHGVAGESQFCTIQACDQYGNKLTNVSFTAEMKLTNDHRELSSFDFVANILAVQDGTCTIKYSSRKAGNLALWLKVNGIPLQECPMAVIVEPGITWPANCAAYGPPLSNGQVGVQSTFFVRAKDKYGNERFCGGDDVSAVISGSGGKKFPIEVLDTKNGEYSLSYLIKHTGIYALEIKINNQQIGGSPFELAIRDLKDLQSIETNQLRQELGEKLKINKDLSAKVEQLKNNQDALMKQVQDIQAAADIEKKKLEAEITRMCVQFDAMRIRSKGSSSPNASEYFKKFRYTPGHEAPIIEFLLQKSESNQICCLPITAEIIAKCVQSLAADSKQSSYLKTLFNEYNNQISELFEKSDKLESMYYWLSQNIHLLLSLKEMRSPEMSKYIDDLAKLTNDNYVAILKSLQGTLSPIVIAAFSENSSSGKGFILTMRSRPKITGMENVIFTFTETFDLLQIYPNLNIHTAAENSVTQQLFCQMFYFISTLLSNSVLAKKPSSTAVKNIKANIALLEGWAVKDCKLDAILIADSLKIIRHIIELILSLPSKISTENVKQILDLSAGLNDLILRKILDKACEKTSKDTLNEVIEKIRASPSYQSNATDSAQYDNSAYINAFYTNPLVVLTSMYEPVQLPHALHIPQISDDDEAGKNALQSK